MLKAIHYPVWGLMLSVLLFTSCKKTDGPVISFVQYDIGTEKTVSLGGIAYNEKTGKKILYKEVYPNDKNEYIIQLERENSEILLSYLFDLTYSTSYGYRLNVDFPKQYNFSFNGKIYDFVLPVCNEVLTEFKLTTKDTLLPRNYEKAFIKVEHKYQDWIGASEIIQFENASTSKTEPYFRYISLFSGETTFSGYVVHDGGQRIHFSKKLVVPNYEGTFIAHPVEIQF